MDFGRNAAVLHYIHCYLDSSGRQLRSEEVRLTVSSRGDLHRTRALEVSSDCEQLDDAWKCQLRYSLPGYI